MKFLAAYIMRGRLQAMTVASTLALISLLLPPVSIISSASVALVTLRHGAKEGLVVLISSCVAAALLGMLILANFQFAIGYSAVLWFPVWLIAIVLRVGRRIDWAIEIAVMLGVLAVLGFYLINAQPVAMWLQMLQQMVAPMLAMQEIPPEQVEKSLAVLAHFMTGIVAAGSVSGLLLGLLLGRWWQSSLYNPGGFRAEYLALRSHPALAFGFLAVIAVANITSGVVAEIAWNASVPLFVLYAFIGMAVLHVLLSATKIRWFLLPTFYVLILIIPHTLIAVAFIGLGDTWLNLRNRVSIQSDA